MQKQNYQELAPSASAQAKEIWRKEHTEGGFVCIHCGHFVPIDKQMGTLNRNHCNTCLWSKHVDETKGDRAAICNGKMAPIGLTFKQAGVGKIGEIMLIHRCEQCGTLSINRVARDDQEYAIMQTYENSLQLAQPIRSLLSAQAIYLATEADAAQVRTQLFGE